jgi:Mrp family chromosome partitioning ATPase
LVDGVVLTLRIRRKSKPNSKEAVNILHAVGARVLGVVINNSDEAGASDGYRGYGYYRYGRYTSRYARRGGGANGDKSSGGRESMMITGRGDVNRSQSQSNGSLAKASKVSNSNPTDQVGRS